MYCQATGRLCTVPYCPTCSYVGDVGAETAGNEFEPSQQ
jgi:hypothetical protein